MYTMHVIRVLHEAVIWIRNILATRIRYTFEELWRQHRFKLRIQTFFSTSFQQRIGMNYGSANVKICNSCATIISWNF
jgi:hypothetical protein